MLEFYFTKLRFNEMPLKGQFLRFTLMVCLPIMNVYANDYFVIDPSKELSSTFNALGLRSFEERTLIEFTFYPDKQTGQNQVFNSDEMKKIELEDFELQNIVKTLYPFDRIQMKDAKKLTFEFKFIYCGAI